MLKSAKNFVQGAALPVQAIRLIFSRSQLIFWSAIPIAITALVYYLLIGYLQGLAQTFLQASLHTLGWADWIIQSIVFITTIAVWIFAAVTFSFAAALLASPFNDILAERAEEHTSPPLEKVESKGFSHHVRVARIDLAKTFFTLGASLLALVVCWIPVINFAAFLSVTLLMTFQYVSYPQTRRRIGLFQGLLLKHHFAASLGLGLTLTFLFSLPIISLFVLPVAVVSGTLLFAQTRKNLPL